MTTDAEASHSNKPFDWRWILAGALYGLFFVSTILQLYKGRSERDAAAYAAAAD